jgi:hypothetical protein
MILNRVGKESGRRDAALPRLTQRHDALQGHPSDNECEKQANAERMISAAIREYAPLKSRTIKSAGFPGCATLLFRSLLVSSGLYLFLLSSTLSLSRPQLPNYLKRQQVTAQ